jgi:hypothetical protein
MPERKVDMRFEIDAPIETVWQILTDLEGYPRWNPFVVQARSQKSGDTVGAMMTLSVRWRDGSTTTSTEEVIEVHAPGQQDTGTWSAEWVYSFRSWMSTIAMIRSVRTQKLVQIPDGPTEYISQIHLSGWGAGGAPLSKIKAGIEDQALALKESSESVSRS